MLNIQEPEGTLEPRVLVEVPAGHAAGGDIGRVGREHPDVGHQGEELHRVADGAAYSRQFYGASLSGDGLDYNAQKQMILTGSYRTENQLQLWDFRSRKLYKNVPWTDNEEANK